MRRHIFLIVIGLTIAVLLALSSQAAADTAKYLVPLYKISKLGPPIQYGTTSVGNADIAVTEQSFTVEAKLHLNGGLPNTKYRFGFGVKVGARWVVTGSSLTTDDKGAGSATLTMNIPEKAAKPYTVAVCLSASGNYIASKRVTLLKAP